MANQFHVGQGYFSIGSKFDSRNRYVRSVANIADKTLNMARGPTLAINVTAAGEADWRWQCNAATIASNTGVGAPAPGFNLGLNIAV